MSTPDSAPVGPAIAVDATRRSLRRYLLVARLATAIAALSILTAVVVFLVHTTNLDLQRDGATAQGTVESVSAHQVGNTRLQITFLTVRYSAGGDQRVERLSLGRPASGFHQGQTVTVRYDEGDPSVAEVQGYPAHQSLPPLIPLGFGMIVLVFSWPGIRRARFVQKILTGDPWDAHPSEIIELPLGGLAGISGRVRFLLRLEGMTGVVIAAPVGLRRLNPTFAPVAWVAGYGDRQMVVAPPGGSPIVCVKRVGK